MQEEHDLDQHTPFGWNSARARYVCRDNITITGLAQQSV